ncbi:MAG: glycerophosphodiester phosphodiesterase [Actinomycetota bacterium]|nr:glycerophosphodiester phosphodiesterase [Actinomycetota bacterium]
MTWNIGHRGAAGLEPENTLRSFRRAVEEGADVLEIDLRLTRDGHLVVLHDYTVDRTTNGTGPVHGLTLAEVQRLDGGLGEKVPTFREALGAATLPIHAELKVREVAEPLARLLLDEDVDERVTPISFDPEALRQVKRVLPDRPVGLVLSGAPPEATERARAVGADLISLEWAHLDAEAVERCRRAELKVTAWTVNEPEQIRRVIGLGVEGITTDRPDLLAAIIEASGNHGRQ